MNVLLAETCSRSKWSCPRVRLLRSFATPLLRAGRWPAGKPPLAIVAFRPPPSSPGDAGSPQTLKAIGRGQASGGRHSLRRDDHDMTLHAEGEFREIVEDVVDPGVT